MLLYKMNQEMRNLKILVARNIIYRACMQTEHTKQDQNRFNFDDHDPSGSLYN
jgi:hypothetical protein